MTFRHASVIPVALAALALLPGCADTSAPRFASAPEVRANPNPAAPLAAIVSAATDEPAELVIEVSDDGDATTLPAEGGLTTEPTRAVVGLKPGRAHRLLVRARDAAGNVTPEAVTLEFETAPLPEDFPPLEVVLSSPEKMEPGVTLFALMKWPDGGEEDHTYGLALAVNHRGEVVWYYRTGEMIEDPHPLPNGNLLCLIGNNRVEEVDMLGNVVARWHASRHPNPEANAKVPAGSIAVDAETLHHEIRQMPSGNLLTLSTEMRRIEDYPSDVSKPGAPAAPANVIGDVVIEFARDGSIVNEWKLMDMLDVGRLGYDSLAPIWDDWAYVDVAGGTKDWAHGNSVFYEPSDDSILVSMRHQEAVIKFSRQSGELLWILGTPDGWGDRWKPYLLQPQGDFEWQYHQHAARMTASGTLLLFDNGNYRSMPPHAKAGVQDSYSRVVEFAVDSGPKTVKQVWHYGGAGHEIFFSPFISEADPLPATGNILVTDGGRIRDKQGRPSDAIVGGRHWARIVEVTHSDPPQKVFELHVDDPEKESGIGWAVYRSERLPGLYAK